MFLCIQPFFEEFRAFCGTDQLFRPQADGDEKRQEGILMLGDYDELTFETPSGRNRPEKQRQTEKLRFWNAIFEDISARFSLVSENRPKVPDADRVGSNIGGHIC